MATIHSLITSGVLKEVVLQRVSAKRRLYGFPEFTNWLECDLPNLSAGRLKAADPPREQVFYRIHQWIIGRDLVYSRQFNDLMPVEDEVWELKTADIRMFGWIYRPSEFVAVFGDYADLYKGQRASKSYDTAVGRVVDARSKLNLDEPKWTKGIFDDLVRV